MRVNLVLQTLTSPELEQKVKGLEIIRLLASVQFKTTAGWSKPYDAEAGRPSLSGNPEDRATDDSLSAVSHSLE